MLGLDRETVEVVDHQTSWARACEREVDRLDEAIGDQVVEFAHVGSTAVPGLPAKPVIDVLATVPDLDDATAMVEPLEANGYEYRPDDRPRLFFAKGPRTERTHYLHVAAHGSEYAESMVAFRDALRADPERRAEYAALKRDLAQRFPDDREAYTEHKHSFVESVLAECDSE